MADLVTHYIFYEVAALLVLAALGGMIGARLGQPLIICFILVGILAGPAALGLIRSNEAITLLAELGIAVLLFLVGLKLDIGLLRSFGPTALVIGLGQIIATFAAAFLISLAMGLGATESLLVGVALCFSSTIVIVKLLSDKGEIDSLHGRIALGVLIVQDIAVVIAMIALSGIAAAGEKSPLDSLLAVLVPCVLMVTGVGLVIRFVSEPLVAHLGRMPELLLFFVIGWAALLAALGHYFGIGKELGGLLAGICFASTSYRDAIAARLASLRDFLLLFFFIALGASFDLAVVADVWAPALVLTLFVLLGKPLIVMAFTRLKGFSRRTALMASLTLGQISEFSMIFLALAVQLEMVRTETLAVVTLVGLVSITVSSSVITYAHRVQAWADRVLPRFLGGDDGQTRFESSDKPMPRSSDVTVFGLGRYGLAVARALKASGKSVRGVDFSPEAVAYAEGLGIPATFGDVSDREFVANLKAKKTGWAICAIPAHLGDAAHEDTRLLLKKALEAAGFRGRFAVVAHSDEDAATLSSLGADQILMPYRDAALQAAALILTHQEPGDDIEMLDPQGQKEFA